MNPNLRSIVDQLRMDGKDYANFHTLLTAIIESGQDISKDDILEFVNRDYRIQLHSTPNSIAKLINHLAKAFQPKNAIDICCGTGNILYYLQNQIDELTGVEIVDNVAELTKFFIPELNIITADTFHYPFTRQYDLVVGMIPFGMKIEFDGYRIPCEEAFLRKAHTLLAENGRAIMLVPYSVLSGDKFQGFRNDYLAYLSEIVVLPLGKIRNINTQTAVLVFGRKEAKDVRIINLNDFENLDIDYANSDSFYYSKDKMPQRWDLQYLSASGSAFYKELEGFQTVELKELAEIIKGKFIPAETLKAEGDFLYLKPLHIQKDGLKTEAALKYISKGALSERDYKYILQPGDLVISTIFADLKMYIYQVGDIPAIASNNLAIIRSSKQDYILSYLQTDEGKHIFKTQAQDLRRGVTIPHISIQDLSTIKIPILPIENLNAFGDSTISSSTEAQLLDALEQLRDYKMQIQSLEKEKENLVSLKTFIQDRFDKVENQLILVNRKLDDLIYVLKELKNDFDNIQRMHRDEEERLFKMYQKIDLKLESLYTKEQQTIECYIDEIKRWLDLWELLDIQSKKFLPIAEFIFDELSKLEDADYAPFVVQYCRTLENEILKKLFEEYHLKGLAGVSIDELIKGVTKDDKTYRFADMVKKGKVTYTLGDMHFIMSLLKEDGNTLKRSPLLQHFRTFTISYFDERIIAEEFLNDVSNLTKEFRNKAAHPYSISIVLAKECQSLLRKSLNVFLESVKI